MCDVTIYAIHKAAKQNRYEYRYVEGVGRGGKQMMIVLESLPEEAQSRYHHQAVTEPQDKAAAELATLTEKRRNDVFFKLGVIRRYQEFKETYPKADKMVAFLRMYNEEHTERPLSRRQLNHWETLYNREGVTGLIDRRGTWNKGVSSIPEEVAEVFRAYWMQEKGTRKGGPSVASCYRLTQLNFPGVELPSVSTFARYAQSIPYLSKVLAREGDKAFKDKCEPYMPFDYRSICTNELWTADNHVFDLWVKDKTGRVFRPWIIGWMDKRSRYIVGYLLIDHDPNSDAVADAFSRAVHACGIPEKVQLDNGADYCVPDLFDPTFVMSLANQMCMDVTHAIPYNAKSKLIERFFNTIEYSYCIHLPSYFGADPKRRPERMQKACDKLKDVAMPYEEFQDFLDGAIGQYNNTVHSGDAMDGRTPRQAFMECVVHPIRVANSALLALYFKRTSRLLTVGRNGVRVPELKQYYDSEELLPYRSMKVYARYNTDDVRQVYCFSEEGEFICMAASIEMGGLNQELTAQNLRRLNAKKKQCRNLAREYIPDIAVPSMRQLAIQNGFSFEKADLSLVQTVDILDPAQQKKAQAVQAAEQRKGVGAEQSGTGKTQRERDKAYYNFVTGGLKDASG